MSSGFDTPQRQSILGILVMFVYTLQSYLRAFWPVLLIWFLKYRENDFFYFILVVFVFVGIVGIISYLKYLNFTFYINKQTNEFVITEGILSKTKTYIQLTKIQQVNINQSLIQKFVGVYQLVVDTAGTNKKEVDIKAISHALALDLKAQLLSSDKCEIQVLDGESEKETALKAQTEPFIKISFLSLIKIGITSNYVRSFLILLAFFLSLFDHFNQITGRDVLEDQYITEYAFSANLAIGLTLLIFLVVIAFNVVKNFITYFDYKLSKDNTSLLLSYGLLNTRKTILKPQKVQITSISQNYFQKKMDVLHIKIIQASGGSERQEKQDVQIPGCNKSEKDSILELIFGGIPQKGMMIKPNFRKLGFAVFLTMLLPFLLFLGMRNILIQNLPLIDFFVLIYLIFVGILQVVTFLNSRLFVHKEFIMVQSGAWDVTTKIIVVNKIQAITTSQLFWHKNINIGSITLHTAAGNISFQLGNFTSLKQYVDLWLYEMETTDSNWI